MMNIFQPIWFTFNYAIELERHFWRAFYTINLIKYGRGSESNATHLSVCKIEYLFKFILEKFNILK